LLRGGERIFPRDLGEWILRVFAVLLAITVHELSHAWTAYKLGDATAKQAGRISLNPLSHMDPLGTVMLLLVGFGWARPVPINPLNFRRPRRDEALVSLAGPMSNFVCAIGFGLALRAVLAGPLPAGGARFAVNAVGLVQQIVVISLILGVFNLIPIPPLDGSHILRGLLPAQMQRGYDEFSSFGPMLLLALLVVSSFTGILSHILWPPVVFLFRLITGVS
jgi:Zn-dependent protease